MKRSPARSKKGTKVKDDESTITGEKVAMIAPSALASGQGPPTETIDLNSLFTKEQEGKETCDLDQGKLAPFTKLMQALSVPTLLISRSHEIKFANKAFFSVSRERFSLKGLTFASLFPNPKEARQAQLLLEKVFTERKPLVQERVLQINRTRIWGRMHLRSMRLGSTVMVLVQLENLTAQKQLLTAEKYKKLVDIFPIGIAEFALSRGLLRTSKPESMLEAVLRARVIDGNKEFANAYGRNDIQDMLGVRTDRVFPFKGKAQAIYDRWINSGFPIYAFDTKEIATHRGLKRYENTLIANFNNSYFLGFWWLKKDVSDKKRVEEEMLKAQKIESIGILAGGIAHDFNNLLTGVLGNIAMAQMHLRPEDPPHKRLAAAHKAAARAQDLTRQLLTFSTGGAPIKKHGSIGELLKDWATFGLRGSTIRPEFSIPEGLWLVEMDEGQISQVVNNLIINGAQAMPQGGTLRIQGQNVEIRKGHLNTLPKGKYVKISISDKGGGIATELLPKIFDPYFTTKPHGSGLGLATSYSIIAKHGGLLTVESEVGAGTTFHFYLPASSAKVSAPVAKELPVQSVYGKVLVMDDEEIIRDLAGELLTCFGFEVSLAKNGEEAIALYKTALENGKRFDLVIMDLTIPGGMGGKEAIRRLKEMDPHVTAIVSSGYCNDPVMADYTAYGFKGVLPKPYDGTQLSQILQDVISRKDKAK